MKTVDSRKINTAKIRDLRLERGITQAFIARRMGYKYTSGYSNIEKGTVRLSHKNAVILSEILMCELNFFYE
ncbi:helix-turn-helix transcriptional regulator [Listeria seeligeri]|uniref:Helix-turn-helix transcriptional regulator n=3 Tax=Listeria TaxID=1637 RepID=A0A7X1DB64_9LIST|nr:MULTISPECIES: helix-turn-helix transcriptional regulator [Listeria]EFR84805.1 transcriptional regulator, putative [Listeria monocytogenes FSL F2-208]EAC6872647.1 XRE family transcriptional regulator [Listeria monocytogenes]EAC7884799.1 XRE family transcriptional regulator [Listeria monocytogenes]EAC8432607.1 XRE family transcriptional regulator [Listeria monocytogenes]EAC8462257.1 XRE family transcriptional regulator [Listeria monocytogenes]